MSDADPGTQDPGQGQEPPQDPAQAGQGDGGTPEPDATDWKAKAREWERRAKANSAAAKKLADIEAASQTEAERLQATAKAAEERAAAAVMRVASAEIRAALAGVVPDPSAVVEDLNVARFLTDDGDVDAEKVSALRAKYAALAPSGPRAPLPNPAQGQSTPARSLGELIADAEKNRDPRTAMKLKSQQLVQLRRQG